MKIIKIILWPIIKLFEFYTWVEAGNRTMEYKLGIKYKDMGYEVEGMDPEIERIIRKEMKEEENKK